MKKKKFIAILIAFTASSVIGLTACGGNDDIKPPVTPDPPPIEEPDVDDKINVGIKVESVKIKDYEVAGYNFARHFAISDDGSAVPTGEYVNSSSVKAEAGEYEVTCTYKGKTATLKVTVEASECVVTLSREEVSLNTAALSDYDFKSLFKVTIDGKSTQITDSMITTDLKNEAGKYTYTVTCGSASKTLKITVIDEYAIEILNSFKELELTKADLEDFDFTQLFSIFVGGIAEEVKEEYIDSSSLASAEEGNSYSVTINFEKNGRQAQSTVKINVVAQTQITVNAKTVITYPNSENIDLKTLFEVKRGSQLLTVTDDMISGVVDYSKAGDNIITLNYGGRTYEATVKVQMGVIIGYASSDTVLVQKGTNKDDYDFGADFTVVINGIKFNNFDKSYFDLTNVDFGTVGEYTVRLTVPYNTKQIPIGSVPFDYFEKEITYQVVEKKVDYSIKILEEEVILPSGTTKYNVFNNLHVVIDGIKRIPYDNLDYLGATTCYALVKSQPLDFSSPAEQYVEIDVYVYGPDAEPVTVAFSVRIDNGVEVKGSERVVFSGTSVYPKDLFTITEKGENIEVTNAMVTGKIDLFKPGIYFVTADYKGVTAQSKVVVLDRSMTGTYKTSLTSIEKIEDDYDDDNGDYGWDSDGDFDYSGYTLSAPYDVSSYAAAGSLLGDFTVDEEGNMFFGSTKLEMLSIVDDSTFEIKYRSYEYVMSYGDGIITLDPINSVKLTYHDDSRPMVFFNENKWTVGDYVQINSSSQGYHVLQRNSSGNLVVSGGAYSLDLMKITSATDGEEYWYGIKTKFLTKTNADTYYDDEIFGFAVFAPDFEQKTGNISSVQLDGERYEFTMSSPLKGIINKESKTLSPFAGMTFKGKADGKDASFIVSAADKITLRVDGKTVIDLIVSEQKELKNAGIDYSENTWLIYNKYYDKENTPVSYRLRLDKENKTFTVDERDDLFGRYVYGNVCFFFDGYGSGEVWFDTSSKYMTTAFTYVKNGSNVSITYRNASPDFTHGKTAQMLFADYKNVLTVREITDADNLIGKKFVNQVITDGAVVEVNNLVLGKGSAENELFDGLSITTKDGALSSSQMKSKIDGFDVRYVDVSAIQFYRAGFYQLTVNIPVGGEIKSAYYAVQILDSIYSGNKLVGRFAGVINSGSSLTLDEFGRISGVFSGISFSGKAVLRENTFTAAAECKVGALTVSGEFVSDGILKVTARGALTFTDYFTVGSSRVCGTEGYTLRAITVGETTVYALFQAATSVGNIVEVEAITGNIATLGSILKIVDGNKELFVKITEWGSASKGLILSDSVRGTYAKADNEDLVLDGFGKVTYGTKTGTYTYYGNGVTAIFGAEIEVFNINTSDKTYEKSGKEIDVTLFAGKSFEASYYFDCDFDNYSYRAITTFDFLANGKVVVKSSSSEHDEECGDKYNPEFATNEGIEGTFTVVGNKITVTVNGKTISFTFTDAVGLGTITCSQTEVSASSHGYFATGTVFGLV